MTNQIELNVEFRGVTGKGVCRAFRRDEKIPAIVYGIKDKQYPVVLNEREFMNQYTRGGIGTKLVILNLTSVDGAVKSEKIMAVVRDVQLHPVTDMPVHVDFHAVEKSHKIRVPIYIKIINRDKCPGLKKDGLLNLSKRTIEFMCDPEHIPPYIEVDISKLEIGQSIHISGLKYSDKIQPVTKEDIIVVSLLGKEKEGAAGAGLEGAEGSALSGGDSASGGASTPAGGDDKKKAAGK